MTRTDLLRLGRFVVAVVCVAAVSGPLQAQDADIIVRNARIWTGDSLRPLAQAVAIRGERIIAVGTNADVDARRGSHTRVIDAGGRFVTPGFIDDHTHFSSAGALLIAFVEVFVHRYVNAAFPDKPWVGQLQDIYVFGILILVLMFKPSGLLGKATVEKV